MSLQEKVKGALSGLSFSHILNIVLIVILLIGGWMFSKGLEEFHKALGRAEENFALYQEANKKLLALEHERAKQTAQLDKRGEERKKAVKKSQDAVAKKVKEVTRPDLSLPEVAKLAEIHLGELPTIEQNGLFFSQAAVQRAIALDLRVQSLEIDLAAAREELVDKDKRIGLLNASLMQAQENLRQADRTIDSYQKVVKKSKWRIVRDVGVKVGLTLAGIGIGSLL